MIDARLATPSRDGGSRAIADLIDALADLGNDVHYFYDSESEAVGDPWRPENPVPGSGGGTEGLGSWLAEFGDDLDVAVSVRPIMAARCEPLLAKHPRIARLYFGMDSLEMRSHREARLKDSPMDRARILASRALERRCWHTSDVITHPTTDEAELVSRDAEAGLSLAVPIFCFDSIRQDAMPPGGKTFVFVGGSGYEPNRDGLDWFVREILPQVTEQIAGAELTVVGHWPPALQDQLTRSSVVAFTGVLSDAELDAVYSSARAAIAPVRFGAGVKSKVAAALAHGVPVVSTTVGLEGLDVSGLVDATQEPSAVGTIRADDPQDFASGVSLLLSEDAPWRDLSDRGGQFVRRVYCRDRFLNCWEQVLSHATDQRDMRVAKATTVIRSDDGSVG